MLAEQLGGRPTQETKETPGPTPYVVSADIRLLLQQWADKRGYTLPDNHFFTDLRGEFNDYARGIFPGYQMVSEVEMSTGLSDIVNRNGLFPVSLDKVYYPTIPGLDLNRQVDINGQDRGIARRADTPLFVRQLKDLRDLGVKEVALVDDVIFTGTLIGRVSDSLERMGIQVPVVCGGIGVGEGIQSLQASGKKVECVRTYTKIVDEICERDFYPGVPQSGRLLANDGNVGLPYVLPFGNPQKWASIPAQEEGRFSEFCLKQTKRLFEAIETFSGRSVNCEDLDRKVIGLPQDNTRFVDALNQVSMS